MHTVVVNRNSSPFDVYIGRPGPWGNPYGTSTEESLAEHLVETREEAIKCYRTWMCFRLYLAGLSSDDDPDRQLKQELLDLQGKRLGCWCAPKLCHGDVLKELSDALAAGKTLQVGPDGYYFG